MWTIFSSSGVGQVGEKREPREDVDDVVAHVHLCGRLDAGSVAVDRVSAGLRAAALWMPIALTIAPSTSSAAPSTIAMWNDEVDASRTTATRCSVGAAC